MISKLSDSDAGVTPEAAATPPAKPRKVLPVHPLLFVLFPFLAYYSQNFGKEPLADIIVPVIKYLIGASVLWLVFYLTTRQGRKAALAASLFIMPFFAFGHIRDLLPKALYDKPELLISILLVGVIALLIPTLRTRQPLYDTTSGLNFMAILLLLPSCWNIAVGVASRPDHVVEYGTPKLNLSPTHKTITADRHLAETPQDVPDVYYIILDAYGRADRLQTYYNYDNTPFLQALESRGFFIANQSEANYNQTPLCLASALSMNYLDVPAGQSLNPELLRQRVDDNAVAAFLRTKGYHYIDIASGLEESRVNTADMVLNDEPDLSIVENQIAGLTAFGAIKAEQTKRYDRHRRRLNGGFDTLAQAAALPYPKFVFAHILAPHPPFVFGPNGESVNPKDILNLADASDLLEKITKDEYRQGYIAQLQYINKRALQAVDAILSQSKHKPIIIIQGDHGSRMNLDWKSLAKTDLREPFSNLNAYLVPQEARRHLTEKITAVNSFRIVLTDVFGANNLPRIPDRNFYSTEEKPYDFVEVTDRLNRMAAPTHPARSARSKTGQTITK